MKHKNRGIYALFLLLSLGLTFSARGQNEDVWIEEQAFSMEEFFTNIIQHHPVVRQARFLSDLAQQELRLARGAFDPKLKSNFDIKEFGGTTYYKTWDSKLEVPIWFNTDLNVGYEQNEGEYLNEQLQNTSEGLIYAGVSLPVGRRLFIDERRAAVRQANLMQDMAEAEKIKEINKVLLKAAKAYWDWYNAYQNYLIYEEVEELARERYNAIVQQVINGDVAPFDSLKAFINYQQREVQKEQAELDYTNAGVMVSNFLWRSAQNDDMKAIPLQLAPSTYPVVSDSLVKNQLLDVQMLTILRDSARVNHPEIIKLDTKISQLEIEQRLNREFLKPEVNLKYNFLTKTTGEGSDSSNGSGNESFFLNDYKLGMELYFPLFLRKERAKLEKTTIKLEQNYYERQNQARTIENEIIMVYNSLSNFSELMRMQQRMVDNYQALLNGELIKFENGESSVFLINTRETELLDARIKLLKLQTQYEKSKIELLYAAGIPYLQL
ncbi:outer membrane protein TolC [Catalinimonas alkaloidigena]|uniref:TolC family protein n=1 Tax=Catalinimonas alkaloidigena TaxID=1075417 RepID=UPI0024056AB7|nr:TolC family protein [Catalinimonas alkaloidigena]MDF9795509.1 outer membrane protein TolC [Catalinimonas alkaloidigena]